MRIQEIINKKTGEKLLIFGGEDIISVNPDQHYYESCLVRKMTLFAPEETLGDKEPTKEGAKILVESAKECREFIDNFRKIDLPANLKNLLNTTKKREQEKILNGLELTPDILMAFLLYAGDNGYLFSEYSSEHHSSALKDKKMPLAYRKKDDGSMEVMGTTDLSEGQLKQNLEQRTVKVGKILEKGDEWHCFFVTFNSLLGKENWRSGQPHFHYLSNLFGFTKEEVIEQIKSKDYKLGNLPHITLKEYGNQPENKAST
ncbi:hypothetical protein EG240_15735 [Paenimyroides tangerinum]|uniref:Uncharacterized protein n=1 Tax=Paenimyroides tangerinum TaxID=2488728 RepID=A0A3P3W255_9FLAO|nr:hypothetical protein [Paenimyroides tangerinum]RRJ86903.1 hypothetical protein EG240_15735 [Paenimyroides tangerinum]